MQVVRKFKTIQADKLRSIESCFLANRLQDFFHNLEKNKVNINNVIIFFTLKEKNTFGFIFKQAELSNKFWPYTVRLNFWNQN